MAIARKNYGDCADELPCNMFEEEGRQRIAVEVLVVVVCGCVLSLVFFRSFIRSFFLSFVRLFCEVAVYFLWMYNMELVLQHVRAEMRGK